MIMGFDTLGNIYTSFTQVNTNGKIIMIYLRELAKKLDKERPDWR